MVTSSGFGSDSFSDRGRPADILTHLYDKSRLAGRPLAILARALTAGFAARLQDPQPVEAAREHLRVLAAAARRLLLGKSDHKEVFRTC